MQLADLVAPYLDGIEAVTDETPEEWELGSRLRRLDPVVVARADPAAPAVGDKRLLVTVARPEGREALRDRLAGLPVGTAAVLLMAEPPGEGSWAAVLDAAVRAECQVLQVAPLEGIRAAVGVVCRRTDVLLPRRGHFGDPQPEGADATALPALLRTVGEAVFTDAWSRATRSEVEALTATVARLEAELATARSAQRDAEAARAAAERREEILRRSLPLRIARKAGAVLRASGLRGRGRGGGSAAP